MALLTAPLQNREDVPVEGPLVRVLENTQALLAASMRSGTPCYAADYLKTPQRARHIEED
jgi:hypothetical protein